MPRSSPPKILVVDDEEFFRALLHRMLGMEGYQVLEASTGEEAITLAEREMPQLVLLDYVLVGETGKDIFMRLRARWPHLPVVMVTGHDHVEPAVDLMKSGVFDFVFKPFQMDHLLEVVRRALSNLSI